MNTAIVLSEIIICNAPIESVHIIGKLLDIKWNLKILLEKRHKKLIYFVRYERRRHLNVRSWLSESPKKT